MEMYLRFLSKIFEQVTSTLNTGLYRKGREPLGKEPLGRKGAVGKEPLGGMSGFRASPKNALPLCVFGTGSEKRTTVVRFSEGYFRKPKNAQPKCVLDLFL